MAGPSSKLDDSDMLEYSDTIHSDSDFILEGDTNNICEDDDAPHEASPTTHPVSDSEEDNMDDDDYRQILSPEQPLPLPFQFQELLGPKHMPPLESPPITYFHLFFTDLILTLMVTECNRCAQQVISSKEGNVLTLLRNWMTHAQDEKIPGMYSKYGHHQKSQPQHHTGLSLFPSHPIV
jgi:hypothetical protein